MSDEPLFCQVCGAEDWACPHEPGTTGPYCEVCGVIPREGGECEYFRAGGNDKGCET